MIWNIPTEQAFDRQEELRQYLERFPESPLVPAILEELAYLEEVTDL